jgi:hypothetical protein
MIAFIADLHIANHQKYGGAVKAGINRRCRLILDTLDRAVTRALEEKVAYLVVLGDLFDTARPEPQIVAETQRILGRIPTIVLLGNHDMVSDAAGDHSLGPLSPVPGLRVVEKPCVIPVGEVDLVLVPFYPGPASEWLPVHLKELLGEKVPRGKSRRRVLGLHLGIAADDTPHFLKGAEDSIAMGQLVPLLKALRIEAVLAGNWHSRRHWTAQGCDVMQVGCLASTGWDNEGLENYGTLAFWDAAKGISFEEIPGPRFVKAKAGAGLAPYSQTPDDPNGCSIFLRQVVSDADLLGASSSLLIEAVEKGLFTGAEVVLDDTKAVEAARTAAGAARSAATLGEALAFVVGALDATEEDKAWVTTRVRSELRISE